MPTSIAWKFSLDIPSGPSLALSSAVSVDAYDRIAVTIADAAADVQVDIQPGATGRVKFVMVRSDVYGDNLKYKVHAAANPAHSLTDTLILVGTGALDLLGAQLDALFISNTLGHAANIEIIVGRQAV
jgi:hypothetical protein